MFAFRLHDRWSASSRNASESHEDLDCERLEEIGRLIRTVRVVVIVVAVLRFGFSPPPDGSDPGLHPWLIVLALVLPLSVANVVSRRAMGQGLEGLVRTARIELGIDSIVVLGFLAEMAYEGRQLGFVMLLYPITGAAARFGLRAAAATWLGTGIPYVVSARAVGRYPGGPLPMGSLVWQLITVALLGLLMALLADILMRQLQRVKRQEIDARGRADLLRIAAETGRAMTTFDSRKVLDAALDGGLRIGFDMVDVFTVGADGTWHPFHRPGDPTGAKHPFVHHVQAIVDAVRGQRRTVTVDADSGDDALFRAVREAGFALVVGVPIWGDGEVQAVMVSAGSTRHRLASAELECLELLAAQVGATFDASRHLMEAHGLEDRLAHEISHDRLTGLPNREWFLDRLTDALATDVVSVLVCDIDRFKTINDSLGHRIGDQLLGLVASRLLTVAGGKGMVARIGADQFAIQLCSETLDAAVESASEILRAFDDPFTVDEQELLISWSIGAASSAGVGSIDATTLLRDANLAMYAAKRAGRARCEVFDPDLRRRVRRRMETETDLRRTIADGGLAVAYQPIVSFATGTIVSVEALARWNHPRHGMVPPDEFIPIAEDTGMIGDLGRFVLNEACHEARAWQRSLGDGAPRVAVNLSAVQLSEPGCVDMVVEALATSTLAPDRLLLEITEGVVLGDSPKMREKVVALADLGVHLAVDDFGKGWSSLAYLARYPLTELKIDSSFVAGMTSQWSDRAIVSSVIQLAHELGLGVVAEGIETQAQFNELVRMGCDSGQGYYFHRPLAPLRVSALFQRLVS